MTAFAFQETVPGDTNISSALGTGSGNTFSAAADIGKAVVLAAANNHVLASAGNEIDGFVNSVEPFTVNGGYSFGAVKTKGRIKAVVGANQGATPMAAGDYVVADAQLALGTVGDNQQWANYPGTAPSTPTGPTAQVNTGAPTKKLWRCISVISGTGAAGSVVLLERD
jgi:hypothetical protein